MRIEDHLDDDLLVRSIDDELSGSETVLVAAHLASCEHCRQKHQQLHSLSAGLESQIAALVPEVRPDAWIGERNGLAHALELRENAARRPAAPRILPRLGWGMAMAATLAIGIMLAPQWKQHFVLGHSAAPQGQSSTSFEFDGETFVALPYSNPDLPLMAPHIVQMQVPVSSLADAGIVLEPVSGEVSAADRSVLADVLLGIDGQPLGVHVLSAE